MIWDHIQYSRKFYSVSVKLKIAVISEQHRRTGLVKLQRILRRPVFGNLISIGIGGNVVGVGTNGRVVWPFDGSSTRLSLFLVRIERAAPSIQPRERCSLTRCSEQQLATCKTGFELDDIEWTGAGVGRCGKAPSRASQIKHW